MFRFLPVCLALVGGLLSGPRPAAAQTVIEKSAPVGAGQSVALELKFASSIRVRPATDGQLRVRATVSINQNKLNDAFSMRLTEAGSTVTVAADLDKNRLAQAQPGDCPDSTSHSYYGDWKKGRPAPVCADLTYDVTLPAGTALRITTIDGNIDVQGLTGELQAKSISGFVDVSWPAARGASVALKTISGEVYTDQDVAFSNRRDNPIVGYEVKGTLAGGSGPALRLESISGDVFFRRAK